MTSDEGAGVAGPMLRDIRRQPQVIRALSARRPEVERFARAHLDPGPGGRLYLTGSGDGWFAARAVAGGHAQVRAMSTLPFLVEAAPTLTAADRVLAITMSGGVDRTLEAAEAALARGATVALLTNGDGGRVGALGLPRFELRLDALAPFLSGTASYTASLAAATCMLGRGDTLDGLDRVLRAALEAAAPVVDRLDLAAVTAVRLLAVGDASATADYGAAKLVEVTRAPVWTDDLEEFAHRQFWTASPDELLVLLAPTAAVAAYADASAQALGAMGFTTLAIEAAGTAVPAASARLALPEASAHAWPIVAALPLQLLAYRLALAGGLDPNTRRHLKSDVLRFRTSRLLTRRSLVGTGL